MEKDQDKIISDVTNTEYKYGFYSDIKMDKIPKGLSEEVVRLISEKKNEPQWLLDFRLKSYRHWLTMKMPTWPNLKIAPINYQEIIFYAAPSARKKLNSVDDIDPELKKTFDKLGIPLEEKNQLHAAIVEIVAEKNAEVKYSTVQNWYPGDKDGKGGVYNFVTKRGMCKGENSKISWTQIETGSAITWKYPSCILRGDNSTGEFYSVAVTNNYQQADTGTKMTHIGKNTKSTIVSKGISAGHGQNSYRGLVKVLKNATNARNYSQCDSLLLGDKCGAHTFPYLEVDNSTAIVEHEATTSKIGEDQIFYCNQRGISTEDAIGLIVNGYAREVINKLPMEFAVEAQKLLQISLEGSVG